MVEARPQDDHRLAVGCLSIRGKLTGDSNDLLGGNTGNLLTPCRSVRASIGIIARDMFAAQSSIQAVIGAQQIEDRRNESLALGQLDLADRHALHQHIGMIGAFEMIMLAIAEIGEGNVQNFVMVRIEDRGHAQFDVCALAVFLLQIPFALIAPTVTC